MDLEQALRGFYGAPPPPPAPSAGVAKRRDPPERSPSTEAPAAKRQKKSTLAQLKRCLGVVKATMKLRASAPFRQPVRPVEDDAPDYLSVIAHPMDLGTVQGKLERGEYETPSEVYSDVQLIWENCLNYNGEDAPVTLQMSSVQDFLLNEWRNRELPLWEEPARPRVEVPPRVAPPPAPPVAEPAQMPPLEALRTSTPPEPVPVAGSGLPEAFSPDPDAAPWHIGRPRPNIITPPVRVVHPKHSEELSTCSNESVHCATGQSTRNRQQLAKALGVAPVGESGAVAVFGGCTSHA